MIVNNKKFQLKINFKVDKLRSETKVISNVLMLLIF